MSFDAKQAKLLAAGQHFTISKCPGLRLEASQSKRAWIYRYKSPIDNRMRQTKIGEWPAMSLAKATVEWEIPGKTGFASNFRNWLAWK